MEDIPKKSGIFQLKDIGTGKIIEINYSKNLNKKAKRISNKHIFEILLILEEFDEDKLVQRLKAIKGEIKIEEPVKEEIKKYYYKHKSKPLYLTSIYNEEHFKDSDWITLKH